MCNKLLNVHLEVDFFQKTGICNLNQRWLRGNDKCLPFYSNAFHYKIWEHQEEV